MDFSDPATLAWTAIGAASIAFLAFLLSQPTDFAKWVAKKKYQYEVTFALYMLTPTERFIFNSILFLFTSMLLIAAALYLPEHITFLSRRTFYYWKGDTTLASSASTAASSEPGIQATAAVMEAAAALVKTAYQAAVNTVAVAQEAVKQPAAD